MDLYVGVDAGATNLRVGIFDSQGKLLASSKTNSPLKAEPEKFAGIVKEQISSLNSSGLILTGPIKAIGIGTPGPLDLEKGLLMPSSNIGNTGPIDLRSQFVSLFDSNIYFDRDTNLALLGEAWQGAAVEVKDAVMLTLGSGVGGAILVNGEIERGESGKAGEIGHMIIDSSASVCGFGHNGCLEALVNSAKSIEELGSQLGLGLANIVDIFNPEMIVIGGGKVNMGDFLPKAVEVMKNVGMRPAVDEVEVVYAKLGELSGVYGGARLALRL